MIGTWVKLADETWGVRVKGKALVGSIVTVRFADAREPRTETVREVISFTETPEPISICSIERTTT